MTRDAHPIKTQLENHHCQSMNTDQILQVFQDQWLSQHVNGFTNGNNQTLVSLTSGWTMQEKTSSCKHDVQARIGK